MTGWPRRGVSQSAVMRASESVTPPGGKGTITFTGFCGHCWASALVERNNNSRASFFIRLSIIAAKNAAAKHHRRRRGPGRHGGRSGLREEGRSAGHTVTLLEAQQRIDDSPRASTTQPPTLEMLAELGLIDEYLRVGLVSRTFQFWDRPTRRMIAEFDFARLARRDRLPVRGADRAAQARQHGDRAAARHGERGSAAWESE